MTRKPTRFWHPARRVFVRARERWDNRNHDRNPEPTLDELRPRLQHYLRAMYGRSIQIEPLAAPKRVPLTERLLRGARLIRERSASESDAFCIRLPAELPVGETSASALDRYRVLAVQHAERIQRESATHARQATSDLERDLFMIAESRAIDEQVRESQPGLGKALAAARASALQHRPKPRWRTDIELAVEEMIRDASNATHRGDAQSTADWARRTAAALEAKFGRKAASTYRRVPEITLWDTTVTTRLPDEGAQALETETRATNNEPQLKPPTSTSKSSMPGPSSSSSAQGKGGGRTPDVSQHDATSSPTPSPGNQDGRNPDGDPTSDMGPDARNAGENGAPDPGAEGQGTGTQRTPDAGNAGVSASHSSTLVNSAELADAITFRYSEWDTYANDFHPTGTVVRVIASTPAEGEWPRAALRQHMMLVHAAKKQFERLRSHRLRLRRQVQGDDLDLEACVDNMVERRMGVAPDDRLYTMVRPGRRELAITLLIDVSGSTQDIVLGEQRAIDVERVAALIATAAFDALGDDYSILAFSSRGAQDVRVRTVKEFGERNTELVRQRIAGLTPQGTTRLGAAVRHATAQLSRHSAPHRLLLILSDGKPYDYDWYYVDYAVQDSRRAVIEARAAGIHPFCLTVDAEEGPEYMSDIFGAGGYLMVRKPSELPRALLGAVQRLLA